MGGDEVLLRHESWPAIIQGNDDITHPQWGRKQLSSVYLVVRIVTMRSTRLFPHLTLLLFIVQRASSVVLIENECVILNDIVIICFRGLPWYKYTTTSQKSRQTNYHVA